MAQQLYRILCRQDGSCRYVASGYSFGLDANERPRDLVRLQPLENPRREHRRVFPSD